MALVLLYADTSSGGSLTPTPLKTTSTTSKGLFVVVFTPKQQQRVGREGGKGEEDETKGGVRAGEKHPAEIRGFGEGVFIQNSSSAWGITSTDRRFGQ